MDYTSFKNNSKDIKSITRIIDKEVFKLHDMSKNDIKIIVDAVDGYLSVKSRW